MGTVHLHQRSARRRPTLATLADDLDQQRYRCPRALAGHLDLLLDDAGSRRILLVTGPGGSGKSAALREVGRRARRSGRPVVVLDTRSQDVTAALEALSDGPATVVLVDEADRLGPGLAGLGEALASVPEETRVVLAGRDLPRRWLPTGLEPLVGRLRLGPLAPPEAEALLERFGVDDPDVRDLLRAWARGLPLALVVGAQAWLAGGPDDDRVASALLRDSGDDLLWHLAGTALEQLDPDLLALLVIAPGVDTALLERCFPGRAAEIVTALRTTGVVEPAGGRLHLNPALAAVLDDRLRVEEPARAAATVLRVADHEHARAVGGDPGALARLATLVRDPDLRSGLGTAPRGGHHIDRWRAEDAALVRAGVERRHPGAWAVLRHWAGPDLRVVRRSDGAPVAVVTAMPLLAAAGVGGARGHLLAPVVAHALGPDGPDGPDGPGGRARGVGGDAAARTALTAVQLTFDDLDDAGVDQIRNAAGLAQCGIANPRADYANLIGDRAEERAVLEAYGYREVAGLARTVEGVRVTTWLADTGPAGLAGLLHGVVLAEQGGAGPEAVDPDAVLAGLEAFHDDTVLAGLPLPGVGAVAGASVEGVRAWLRAQVADALAAEPALLDLVTRRYLTAGATHEGVLRSTYLSRATYFRRLRRARELLVAAPDGRR